MKYIWEETARQIHYRVNVVITDNIKYDFVGLNIFMMRDIIIDRKLYNGSAD
jgi:hypothetical protein